MDRAVDVLQFAGLTFGVGGTWCVVAVTVMLVLNAVLPKPTPPPTDRSEVR